MRHRHWWWRLLGLGSLGILGLVEDSWGAIYRCPDATGRQVFSNRPCAGGIVIVPDRLPPQAPPHGVRTRPLRPPRAGRIAVERLAEPPAWTGVPPSPEALSTLPELGQRLCQRQPDRCTRLSTEP